MTPISSLKFSNIENYHVFRVSVDQEKKVEKKKYVLVFRFGVSVFRCFVSLFRGLVMSLHTPFYTKSGGSSSENYYWYKIIDDFVNFL